MGSRMTVGQAEDLGILARAALLYSMGKETQSNSVTTCGAIAHLVPYMDESSTRMLIFDIEAALAKYGSGRHEWVELLTILRRLERP